MAWGLRKAVVESFSNAFTPAAIIPAEIDWDRLVTLDFETYYDDEYTLKKLSTSQYVRDARFKAQMVGVKIGNKPTRCYPATKIAGVLAGIPWSTHSLLAHHAQFDGLILSHHYGIQPKMIYCTLSMARGLHSNDIGAGLHEVSKFHGGQGKIEGGLDATKGVRTWPKKLYDATVPYCTRDVEECLRIFKCMYPLMPAEEIDTIDMTCRMFTQPVLGVDRPRVQKELERELAAKRTLMLSVAEHATDIKLDKKELTALGPAPSEEDILVRKAKKLIGSNRFAELLRAEGVDPPTKISPAWLKKPPNERTEDGKQAFAFARTDLKFVELQEHPNERVRDLVEARLSVKSSSSETRAGTFLKATERGMALPAYYKYAAAHTWRWGGGDRTNMQNLKRGGELRKSIKAPPGHVLVVVDSGQIEARVNAWLWGQDDLLDDFRLYDAGKDRDPYCKFGDVVYGRQITKKDEEQRFVAKTGILALGYQMGAERLQRTLALGINGPKVVLSIEECQRIVYAYRRKNYRIKAGWASCQSMIQQMAAGMTGSHKCIAWSKETLHLPNGLHMHYPNLHDKRDMRMVAQTLTDENYEEFDPNWPEFVYERKDQEVKIYGGLMDENLCQALSRIIVAGQILAVNQKYRAVMTTHDEGVFLAKKSQGEKAYEFARAQFMKAPAWCPDLPLNADGGWDVIYSK